jgi:uncharacterized membrane protein YagU involved in acid resistance
MRPNYLRSVVGGLLGTVAITFLMYFVAPLLIGQPMDIAKMLGDFLGISWGAAMALHFINGTIIFPLIFVSVLWSALPGGPTAKGVSWGLVLWALAQSIVMPLVGGGFFSANAGGFMAVVASLLGHIVYGAILGAVTGVPGVRVQTTVEEFRRAA